MIVYIFGNPAEKSDSLPIKLLPILQKNFAQINFIHADPTENWWQSAPTQRGEKEKDLIIIDIVKGIDTVTVFDNLNTFQKQPLVTPHDYDLYTDLALMKKVGKIESVLIIGIPFGQKQKTVMNSLAPIINRLKMRA